MNTSLDRNEAAALETGEINTGNDLVRTLLAACPGSEGTGYGIAINEMEVFGTPHKG